MTTFLLIGGGGRTMVPVNAGVALPLGQIVSYGDMANDLQARSLEELKRRRLEREQSAKAAAERLQAAEAWIIANKPEGATHAILAIYERDDSDSMTDYYASHAERAKLIGWSRHGRDLFSEMRKAAATDPDVCHLATAGPEVEHREKYSMGAGFYLKAESRYSSGWKVCKERMTRAAELISR